MKIRKISELWTKPSVPLPIKGNKEYEALRKKIVSDWDGVAEFERRPINSKFDISRMHYSEIPAPKKK